MTDHVSVNMMCPTCERVWPCDIKKEEVLDMLVGAAGLSSNYVDLETIPQEVRDAWKAYTNTVAKHYNITNEYGEWKLELINE
jgi:hypothetical protein